MNEAASVSAAADPGIEPLSPRVRSLTAFDAGVLWGDLGIGILVLVTGGLLVPALGFGAALAATVIGSVIGVALLALGAAAGAQHGVPTMVLLRPVLGIRGSWLPSALNVVQLIGWTAVELWAMSYVADLVAGRVFGFSSRPLWLGIMTLVCAGLALWGPVGVTRLWMERFAAWAVAAIVVALTGLIFLGGGIADAFSSPGTGGFPNFGQALDLVIAMPVSWLPLVADYTRYSRSPRGAFAGTFSGYLLANVWLYALGALLVLGGGGSPDPAGVAAGVLSLAGGTIAGILFLVGLLVGETDEAFANIYSGAVSLRNVFPRLSQRGLVVVIALVGAALAAWLTMTLYESFLFLIGSLFVPLFGIVVADHFVVRRGRLDERQLFREGGAYWYRRGVRWSALVPWVAGFAVYHWFNPSPVGPWMELVASVTGGPLSERIAWLGGSIPSFVVAFVLSLVLWGRGVKGRARPAPVSSAGSTLDEKGSR